MDRSLAVAGSVTVAALLLGVVAWPSNPEPPPVRVTPAAAVRTVTVHVSGAVLRPGLVRLDGETRIADAIAAAGGALPDADLGLLNLAAPVGDGGLVVVPGLGTDQAAVATDGRVRVNSATVEELDALPGVGPVLAGRIAAFRDENGPFVAIEDLLSVPGIGESKLDGMRDAVILP